MMAPVEAAFGKKVPLAALFENQTIEGLARSTGSTTRCRERWPILLPFNRRAPAPAVLRLPSTSAPSATSRSPGTSGQDQPVYGLQLQHREEDAAPYQQFEFQTAAEQYLAAMREVQPHGPLQPHRHVRGTPSIGSGIVRMLRASGEKVNSPRHAGRMAHQEHEEVLLHQTRFLSTARR